MTTVRGSSKPLAHATHTPNAVRGDSDVIVLALVAAQALEAQGDHAQATQSTACAIEAILALMTGVG
jgi:protein involved in temperature-dependent protein secretion